MTIVEPQFPETQKRLVALIEYVEKLVEQTERPVFALRDYKNVLYDEADLKAQVGIHHDLHDEDGPIWLKIDRLKRGEPPPAPDLIRAWVDVSRDPSREPVIAATRMETMLQDDAAKLVARGVVAADDVQPSLKSGRTRDHVDVIMRLERCEDVRVAAERYISGPWREWAEAERPVRRTIAIYDAFFSLEQVIQSDPEHPIEVVWGVGVSRWKVKGTEIDHPLIEQLVEIDIDSPNGGLRIRPRAVEPQLALRPFFELDNDGAPRVLEFGKDFFGQTVDDRDLSPFRGDTFTPVLRHAATQLDPRGVYYPDQARDITDRTLPIASENLLVSDAWAIYARQRSGNVLLGDLGRLKNAISAAEALPGSMKRLVTEPSDIPSHTPQRIDIGGSGGGDRTHGSATANAESEEPEDFFFPKAFNDEQIAIVKRLKTADGMVVQGPPGTGKTHTIANIICHCLATGQRVLVTSKAAEPLVEVRNHIPEGIRDLVISLLTTEREGLKQLEQAVRVLSDTALQVEPTRLAKDIAVGQGRVAELRRKLSTIDQELRTWAEKHVSKINLGKDKGDDGLIPAELAERVVRERDQHVWLGEQLDLDEKFEPRFTDDDIAAARSARKALGANLAYLGKALPKMGDLPDAASITALHQDLVNAASLERRIASESLPALSFVARDATARAESLLAPLDQIIGFFDATTDKRWLARLFQMWWRSGSDADDTRLFNEILPAMSAIADRRPGVLRNAVHVPAGVLGCSEAVEAVERAAHGKRPFGAIPFGKAEARAFVQSIRVQGRHPGSTEDWQKVAAYLGWRRDVSEFVARWAAIKDEYGLPPLGDNGDRTGKWIAETFNLVSKARRILEEEWPRVSSELKELFPHGIEIGAVLASQANTASVAEAVKLNLSKARLAGSRIMRADLTKRLVLCAGDVVDLMGAFVEKDLGCSEVTAQAVSDRWSALCRELARIHGLMPQLEEVERFSRLVQESGGANWAQQLRSRPAGPTDDPLTPGAWRESWQWARVSGYLDRIDGHARLRELSRARLECEDDLKKTFGEVVRQKTYLGLKRNLTDRIQSALVMFTQALQSMGTGKGKIRAPRFRRFAREAMEKCYSAVPCWIMPTWRVSEHLPAEIGTFDVVIVDEASQSSVEALPALLRGQKLLIVGDDRQVSPTAAFVEEKRILQLRHNYLKEQPFAQLLLPGSSLYALASAVFPGTRIMLREHFRCVEPIIRFSFQFYPEQIFPLRIPKPSERLDPPLIDVYLSQGRKDKRKINPAEAEAIVAEVETLVKDPVFANRTMGVVSLIGAQQAHFIQQLLLERIGEEAFHRHKIACGDSATFQGKERDIMFVSMVSGPGDGALTSQVFQQRFNVALSRARDRMYLFRSVTEEMLKNPDDLRLKVLRHFKNPMPKAQQPVSDLMSLCESGFERKVFAWLVDPERGYCVTPQVGVGNWRIDLVVEGADDRRLAIELDGDKWHPPEKWLDDMHRQRAMERMGWRFWRCWASTFWRNQEACLADLVNTLSALGIAPMRRGTAKNIYTEHRTVGPAEAGEPKSVPTSIDAEPVVEVGDRVVVSYDNDRTQQATLLISPEQHDPSMGVFKVSEPAAVALLGAAVDDEVSIPMEQGCKTATIIAIDKVKPQRPTSNDPVDRGVSSPAHQLPSEVGPGRQSNLTALPKPAQIGPTITRAENRQDRPSGDQVGTGANRVLEELRRSDEQYRNPTCPQCRRVAHLAITTEGVVLHCRACGKVERVRAEALQELADHLLATCYSCNGGSLKSTGGRFGNYLKCQKCGANNSWQGVSDRIRKT